MEGALESENREVRGSGKLLIHAGGKISCGWGFSSSLFCLINNKGSLDGVFIGQSSIHQGLDMMQSFRSDGNQGIADKISKVGSGEGSKGRTRDSCGLKIELQ